MHGGRRVGSGCALQMDPGGNRAVKMKFGTAGIFLLEDWFMLRCSISIGKSIARSNSHLT
jgi:hypothetical protein